jgi:hypothetical protein
MEVRLVRSSDHMGNYNILQHGTKRHVNMSQTIYDTEDWLQCLGYVQLAGWTAVNVLHPHLAGHAIHLSNVRTCGPKASG